ncbi:MAG: hypothetical protein ABJC12_11455 [Saprospiraceae bacterium]
MKLHLLEELIREFFNTQLNTSGIDWIYPQSMVLHFHSNWTKPEASQLLSMYDQALKSDFTQRWWKREKYRPKEIMLELIKTDPELATIAWKDLSNDAASLDGRLYRFNYYCDELLALHRHQNVLSVESYHHQDASIVSLYLAGLFPSKYTLYPGLDVFRSFCKNVGSPDIPVVDDLVRYSKVANIVFTFLKKDPNFERLSELRASQAANISIIPFQISYELINSTTPK